MFRWFSVDGTRLVTGIAVFVFVFVFAFKLFVFVPFAAAAAGVIGVSGICDIWLYGMLVLSLLGFDGAKLLVRLTMVDSLLPILLSLLVLVLVLLLLLLLLLLSNSDRRNEFSMACP